MPGPVLCIGTRSPSARAKDMLLQVCKLPARPVAALLSFRHRKKLHAGSGFIRAAKQGLNASDGQGEQFRPG